MMRSGSLSTLRTEKNIQAFEGMGQENTNHSGQHCRSFKHQS